MPLTAIGFLIVFSLGSLHTLRSPFSGILLYFFCYYMHPPAKYWGSFLPEIRWTLIVALLTLVSVFMHEKKLTKWLNTKETKLLVLFFCFLTLQFTWSIQPELHKIYFVLFFKLLILIFLLINIVNTKKRLIITLIANVVGCAYLGLVALQTHTRGRYENAGLPGIADGNLLAIHVVPITIIGAFIFLGLNSNKRYLIALPLLLSANLIIMTGSRGAIATIALTGLLTFILAPKDYRARLLKWGALALVAVSFANADLVLDRMKSVTQAESTEDVDKSALIRIVTAKAQLEMFSDAVLLGQGHRTTLVLSPYYMPLEYLTSGGKKDVIARRASHNLTLSIMTDHGIIGFSLFFGAYFFAFLNVYRIARDKNLDDETRLISLGVAASIISVLTVSQFANSKVLEIGIWLIAFSSILHHLVNEKKNEKNKTDTPATTMSKIQFRT